MAIIRIEGMRFYAHHGCFSEERKIGTYFVVDVAMDVDTSLAQSTDNIDDTVNYADVYQVVKSEMSVPSNLLEHVADRIGHSVLRRFPRVDSLRVKVSKCSPPLGGKMDAVSVEIEVLK